MRKGILGEYVGKNGERLGGEWLDQRGEELEGLFRGATRKWTSVKQVGIAVC